MEFYKTNEKIYFHPGDLVIIKHDLPFKPVMLIKNKEKSLIKDTGEEQDNANHFRGMRCMWFSTDFKVQEGVFSTKDLMPYP